jgi:hypothetical protein
MNTLRRELFKRMISIIMDLPENHVPFTMSLDMLSSMSLLISPEYLARIQTKTNSVDDYYTTCLAEHGDDIRKCFEDLMVQKGGHSAILPSFRRFVDDCVHAIEQQQILPHQANADDDVDDGTDDEDPTSIKQLSFQL